MPCALIDKIEIVFNDMGLGLAQAGTTIEKVALDFLDKRHMVATENVDLSFLNIFG